MGSEASSTNIGGNTALHFACSSRHSNIKTNKHMNLIKLLVKNFQDIDQENNIQKNIRDNKPSIFKKIL